MIVININVNEEKQYEIKWTAEMPSPDEINSLAYAVKRKLREVFGHPSLDVNDVPRI